MYLEKLHGTCKHEIVIEEREYWLMKICRFSRLLSLLIFFFNFYAFYRYIREIFSASTILHFGRIHRRMLNWQFRLFILKFYSLRFMLVIIFIKNSWFKIIVILKNQDIINYLFLPTLSLINMILLLSLFACWKFLFFHI